MEQAQRRPTARSNPNPRSRGSTSRAIAGSASRVAVGGSNPRPIPRPAAGYTSRAGVGFTSRAVVGSTSRYAAGPSSGLIRNAPMPYKEEEHEVEVVYTGLPCTCKNCGITFGSYYDYYCHLVYSLYHGQAVDPNQPNVDLELKLSSGQPSIKPNVDLELRLKTPADQGN